MSLSGVVGRASDDMAVDYAVAGATSTIQHLIPADSRLAFYTAVTCIFVFPMQRSLLERRRQHM